MGIYLTNAFSINMLKGDVTVSFKRLEKEDVRNMLRTGFQSAIGHSDLARVVSEMLGITCTPNRINVEIGKNDTLIVAQYIGPRLPEGATTLPENAKIEFWKVEIL